MQAGPGKSDTFARREGTVQEHVVELLVGESVQVGEFVVTVIDVDGGEISFRIDSPQDELPSGNSARAPAPR